ncbi:MAG: trypsin-like peptidase domain-containing protein, partial [Mycobacteriaceae bacterium]
ATTPTAESSSTAASASAATASAAPAATSGGGTALSLQAAYEKTIANVLPSVVEIETKVGLGSGIVFDNQGDIVTNDHVVGSATTFSVRLANNASPVKGTLVGTFPEGDLAVIKVTGVKNLHPATFGKSSQAKVGQIVLAMGNPLGLASSVSDGIISAVGRTLTEPQSPDSPGATLPDSIQTSAAINPGNSGGALVDLDGHVLGIPTLAATDQQQGGAAPGIGFAIPSDTVTKIAPQLIKDGKVTSSGRAALGVRVSTLSDQSGQPAGVGVVQATAGGAAAKAGIQPGDVIVGVDGTKVASAQELSTLLANLDVGKKVVVNIERNGKAQQVSVTLGQLGVG